MKKLIIALVAFVLVLPIAFVACGNGKSEEPQTDTTGTETLTQTEVPTDEDPQKTDVVKQCTLSVKLDNGEDISGVKITLKQGENEYQLVSGENGTVAVELSVGKYSVSYDYDSLPSGCYPDTDAVEITADTSEITLTIIDNNPNGSAEKPYFIANDVTEFTAEAGAEVHFIYRGAALRYLTIANEGVSVSYKGTVYQPENGVVTVVIAPQVGEMTRFSVKNNSSAKIESSLSLLSPEGSMENPIVLESDSVDASVPAGEAVYYEYTAEKNGILVVSSQNTLNNISLINTTTNAVTSFTLGGAATYMPVSAGDTVKIAVASTNSEQAAVIDLSVKCYQGTADDPVPVLDGSVELSFAPSATVAFSAAPGKTVRLSDASATLTVGDKTYTPTDIMAVALVLEGDSASVVFTITNNEANVVSISFEVR